jgi:hypothetical protein
MDRNLGRRSLLAAAAAAGTGLLAARAARPAHAAAGAPGPRGARRAREPAGMPEIDGEFWPVAGNPDLGPLTSTGQQPVDFGVWQAADGTWQLWSCIRRTKAKGRTRLLYRWQGRRLTDADWQPMGIALEADPGFGETEGGLQAPFVLKVGSTYNMFYGDWENICLATGTDGKTFARQLAKGGKAGLYTNAPGANTRDPMVLAHGGRFYAYTTAHPQDRGAVYCRVSRDLRSWGQQKIVAVGGAAGTGPYSAECPFVHRHEASGLFYLFRTQKYGREAASLVYASPDPLDFGVDDDRYLVGELPVAAPEIIEHEGALYLACLNPGLDGIRIARLRFGRPAASPA